MKPVFSVDVEEWFHLTDIDSISKNPLDWEKYPARVEETCHNYFTILDEYGTKGTFFFLGWIAEKYPELVKLAFSKGHEIGVHGYYHEEVYKQKYQQFHQNIGRAKELLESIIGQKVKGYRAPAFSIIKESTWAYEVLMDLGFEYSSSVHPKRYKEFGLMPKVIYSDSSEILEIPLPILKSPLSVFSCFGGGTFRLFPLFWYNRAVKLLHDRPFTFYTHPRDIDKAHPKTNLPLKRKFKSLVNIKKNELKIKSIVRNGNFVAFEEALKGFATSKLPRVALSTML